MSFTWRKLGCLYSPEGKTRHPKLLTHAANPLAVHLEEDIYRIFYSGRDAQNRSSVGAVDINILTQEIVTDHPEPFFLHGEAGSFYADGVSIGCIYDNQDATYMLFMGWQSPADSHWRGDIGRLRLTTDRQLHLDQTTPFISSNAVDPISLSYPWVLHNSEQKSASRYRMWYGSTKSWDAGNGEMLHVIKEAHSEDGEHWLRDGVTLPNELGVAQAFSRPTVFKATNNSLHMWFSYRSGDGTPYRIGYAYQHNQQPWTLALDTAGINVSDTGWDAEMIEYPFVFLHKEQLYLLYNGNGYGKSGFGLAKLDGNLC